MCKLGSRGSVVGNQRLEACIHVTAMSSNLNVNLIEELSVSHVLSVSCVRIWPGPQLVPPLEMPHEGGHARAGSMLCSLVTLAATGPMSSWRGACTKPLQARASPRMQVGMTGGDLEGGRDGARNAEVEKLKQLFYILSYGGRGPADGPSPRSPGSPAGSPGARTLASPPSPSSPVSSASPACRVVGVPLRLALSL